MSSSGRAIGKSRKRAGRKKIITVVEEEIAGLSIAPAAAGASADARFLAQVQAANSSDDDSSGEEGGGGAAGGASRPQTVTCGGRALHKTTFAACLADDSSYAHGWACDKCTADMGRARTIWHGRAQPGESGGFDICDSCAQEEGAAAATPLSEELQALGAQLRTAAAKGDCAVLAGLIDSITATGGDIDAPDWVRAAACRAARLRAAAGMPTLRRPCPTALVAAAAGWLVRAAARNDERQSRRAAAAANARGRRAPRRRARRAAPATPESAAVLCAVDTRRLNPASRSASCAERRMDRAARGVFEFRAQVRLSTPGGAPASVAIPVPAY